jgi:hypothetical protein
VHKPAELEGVEVEVVLRLPDQARKHTQEIKYEVTPKSTYYNGWDPYEA